MKSLITGYIAYTLKTKDGKILLKGAKPLSSHDRNNFQRRRHKT